MALQICPYSLTFHSKNSITEWCVILPVLFTFYCTFTSSFTFNTTFANAIT